MWDIFCIQTFCIQKFIEMWDTFCIQKFVEMWDTFCIQTLCQAFIQAVLLMSIF